MNGEVLVTYALFRTGPEVVKLEYSLRLKIKCYDWRIRVHKQPIIVLYFEFDGKLKQVHNLLF